jgi:hypothetical protein
MVHSLLVAEVTVSDQDSETFRTAREAAEGTIGQSGTSGAGAGGPLPGPTSPAVTVEAGSPSVITRLTDFVTDATMVSPVVARSFSGLVMTGNADTQRLADQVFLDRVLANQRGLANAADDGFASSLWDRGDLEPAWRSGISQDWIDGWAAGQSRGDNAAAVFQAALDGYFAQVEEAELSGSCEA